MHFEPNEEGKSAAIKAVKDLHFVTYEGVTLNVEPSKSMQNSILEDGMYSTITCKTPVITLYFSLLSRWQSQVMTSQGVINQVR